MRSYSISVAILFFALTSSPQTTPAKHPFTAKDWAALHSAGVTAVSPNGDILYQVSHGGEKGPTHQEWWTVAPDGSNPAKLDLPEGFLPMGFTRDGHGLYGSWKVNGKSQLAIFPISDNKAAAVPSTVVLLPRGIDSAQPSPQGTQFAIVADPRPPDPLDDVRHVQEPDQSSLYIVNADGTNGAWWCPTLRNLSGELAWSTDSQSLAVLSSLPRIGHHDVSTAIDVCSASGPRHVTDVANSVTGLAWADNGHDLAFLSTKSAVLTPEHLYTVSASGGTAQDRTPNLDATAASLGGDVRGRVLVLVNRGVRTEVDEFHDDSLTIVFQWPDGVVAGLPVSSPYTGTSQQVAFNVGDPQHTRNVAVPDGNHLRIITHEGDAQLASVDLGQVRVVHWKSKEGIALEGIATFPAGYVEGQKYKFLVLPHGGPEANDELSFDPFSRTIAGLGYVVLQPEYRGSTGYGADFLAAIYQHFGDRAYHDVDSATDSPSPRDGPTPTALPSLAGAPAAS